MEFLQGNNTPISCSCRMQQSQARTACKVPTLTRLVTTGMGLYQPAHPSTHFSKHTAERTSSCKLPPDGDACVGTGCHAARLMHSGMTSQSSLLSSVQALFPGVEERALPKGTKVQREQEDARHLRSPEEVPRTGPRKAWSALATLALGRSKESNLFGLSESIRLMAVEKPARHSPGIGFGLVLLLASG